MYMKYRNYDAVFYTTDEARYEFMTEFFDLVEELDVNALSRKRPEHSGPEGGSA